MGWIALHETRTAKEYFTDMCARIEDIELVDYVSHDAIKAPMAV
jgi:thymidylate synthase